MRLRLIVLCIALSVAAIVVAVVAIHDHRHSKSRINRAELAEWYCKHQGTRCGGSDSDRIHEAWESRERGYKRTEGVLAGALLLGAGGILLSRRRG